jgi:hypothetical protein
MDRILNVQLIALTEEKLYKCTIFAKCSINFRTGFTGYLTVRSV